MEDNVIGLKPIGIIRSPYRSMDDAPRQGRFSDKISEIIVFDEYKDGLDGLDECSHIIVLYWMNRANRTKLKVVPPGKMEERGVFSTRSPSRPNPIGLCVVEVVEISGNVLKVRWLDALDGSPLLDIKKYSPEVDCV